MSNTSPAPEPGPALVAFIREALAAQGQDHTTAWARENGIDPASLTKWQGGTSPTIRQLRLVAEGLGVSLLDLLVTVGHLTAAEAGGERPVAVLPDVDVAIDRDPALSDPERLVLRTAREVYAGLVNGEAISGKTVTVKVGRGKSAVEYDLVVAAERRTLARFLRSR